MRCSEVTELSVIPRRHAPSWRYTQCEQCRRNEFESGGRHTSGAKHRKFFVVPISHFNERFCGQFVVLLFSTHGAPCPAICKSEDIVTPLYKWSRARAHVPYGVGATECEQK